MDTLTSFPDSTACIAIVGMNGVGKSSFGKSLASKLRWKRIDTDTEFKKLYGDIHAFIDAHGWEAFRKAEEEIVLQSLLPGHVVVLGGGAVESTRTRQALEQARVIWLQGGHKRIANNLKRAKVERPEFRGEQTVEDLLNARTPLYEEVADIILAPHLRFKEQMPTAIRLLMQRDTSES